MTDFIPEPLHPELAEYIEADSAFETILRHPLVFCIPYFPAMNQALNRQYAEKRRLLAQHREAGTLVEAIWLYERPYRLDALEVSVQDVSDQRYWQAVAEVWVDSELTYPQRERWLNLLRSTRPDREQAGWDEGGRAMVAMLTKTMEQQKAITLWRGCGQWEHPIGLSWTPYRERAEWFARRFHSPDAHLLRLRLYEADWPDSVLLARGSRGEAELVLDIARPERRITQVTLNTVVEDHK